jgi:mutual gliding-motility protein MglA
MAIINQSTRELQIKIVYYGPSMSGKTSNLVKLREALQTEAGSTGKLISLATSSDRILFFDFVPAEPHRIKDFKIRYQFYTVPGPVIYNTTRQLVLRGVDGLVFVADSQNERMHENAESFQNLEANLQSLTLNLADICYVLQYNKRDLPGVASMEAMEALLNDRKDKVPSFPAIASDCTGVAETLDSLKSLLLGKFGSLNCGAFLNQ